MPKKRTKKIKPAFDIFFYEAFKEETEYLKKFMPSGLKCGFDYCAIGEKKVLLNPPASIISVRTQSVIPLEWADKLKAVITRSTGYDHILKYLKESKADIPCGYLPSYCAQSVAETAVMLAMALARKLPLQVNQFKTFNRNNLSGMEIKGKTAAVIGVGNIGSKIADISKVLGTQVLCADIVKRFKKFNYVSVGTALKKADIIFCAMNLTKENVGYFNFDRFKEVKKGALFINIARGEMSPVKDILKALDKKILAGVALDVYPKESTLAKFLHKKTSKKSPILRDVIKLSQKSNVILTPHNAFNTRESTERKAKQTIEQFEFFLKHGRMKWPVTIAGK